MALFFGYPMVKNVVMSFQNYSIAASTPVPAPFAGLVNYRAIFSSGLFGKFVLNTAIFTVASIAVQFALGLALALFFSRRFPLAGGDQGPAPAALAGADGRLRHRVAVDARPGRRRDQPDPRGRAPRAGRRALAVQHERALAAVTLVNIWVGVPFNMVILYSGLREIPADVYEAAAIDGVGPLARLPLHHLAAAATGDDVVLVLGFIYTVKVIDIILVVTGGGPANASQTLAVESYQLSFKTFRSARARRWATS
jgi:multiple sugar transport system permease protein